MKKLNEVQEILGFSIEECQELMEYVDELEIPYKDFCEIIQYAKKFQLDGQVYITDELLFEIIKESLIGYDYSKGKNNKKLVNTKTPKSTVNRAINIMVR